MRHEIALWAGVTSFFGSILAIATIDVLNPDNALQFIGALVVGLITAGGVYSQQRLADAKLRRQVEDRERDQTKKRN